MFRLLINKNEAVVKTGTSIKLTRENPLFSDGGDYTLDITLPLSGCAQNIRIFGSVNHISSSKKIYIGKRYDFVLETNHINLEGTAIITNVTQAELKLQLVAGASELDLKCTKEDGSDIYIDELDLGWYGENVWAQLPIITRPDKPTVKNMISVIYYHKLDHIQEPLIHPSTDEFVFGDSEKTDAVCLPIYSTEDGWANRFGAMHFYTPSAHDGTFYMVHTFQLYPGASRVDYPDWGHATEWGFQLDDVTTSTISPLAPMPYMRKILVKIINAIGLEIDTNVLSDHKFKNLFIANCRSTLDYNEMLPHWTVKDFLTEVCKLFSIQLQIQNGRVDIVNAETLTKTELGLISDEYNTEINQDTDGKDLSEINTGYDFDNISPLMVAPEEFWESLSISDIIKIDSDDESLVPERGNELPEDERYRTLIILLGAQNRQAKYIYYGNGKWHEVDGMGPIRNAESSDIQNLLKIVPIEMQWIEDPRFWQWWKQTEDPTPGIRDMVYEHCDSKSAIRRCFVTADTRYSSNKQRKSLLDIINDEDNTEEKRDIIEVACLGAIYNLSTTYKKTPGPLVQKTYEANFDTGFGIPYKITDNVLEYQELDSREGEDKQDTSLFILQNVLSDSTAIRCNTGTELQVQYLDDELDPTKIFLIKGKQYRCAKIEITIDEKGIQPLKTGYFYEITTTP